MKKPFALAFWLLAASSIAANLLPSFRGLELLKAAPTALLAFVALRSTRAAYGPWIAVGVALGSVGDWLLATLSKALFLPGLVAFLLGHLAYVVAFARQLAPTRPRVLFAAGVVAYSLAAAAGIVGLDPVVEGQAVAAPVVGYLAVIATMTVTALLHRASTPLIAWGAVVFVVSDSHIPINFIVLQQPLTTLILTGYFSYYLAQFLIVEGACSAQGR